MVCRDIFSSEEIKNIIQWSHEIENLPETKGKWMKYYDPSLKKGIRVGFKFDKKNAKLRFNKNSGKTI